MLDKPFDPYLREGQIDDSGTPVGLIDLVLKIGDVAVVVDLPRKAVLVEFPMGAIWRDRLGCDRFVRLRTTIDGKRYALVRRKPRRRSRGRAQTHAEPQSTEQLIPYPEADEVGRKLALEGAGIMAYETGDQLHPPMVDDEAMWSDARRWPEGAMEHTRAAARLVQVRPGDRVLDIGCGICGPARILVDEFGASVFGIANSAHMLATARSVNARRPAWATAIELAWHDCQEPFHFGLFDVAWSMNMIYRVPDKRAMLRNTATALYPDGRLMLEDWMLTTNATAEDRQTMGYHHYAAGIAMVDELHSLLTREGLRVTTSEDLGHIGRTLLADYFVAQFNERVRPKLEEDFPGTPLSGSKMADQRVEGIEATIRLYQQGKLTYRRLVAVRSTRPSL